MRETSKEAYSQIQENGVLGKLQFAVYDRLFENGPLTQNELFRYYFPEVISDSIKPRFSELLKMGCIKEVGRRTCRITGNEALIWDVTDHVPLTRFKRTNKHAELQNKIEALTATLSVFVEDIPPLKGLEHVAALAADDCECGTCPTQKTASWLSRIVARIRA